MSDEKQMDEICEAVIRIDSNKCLKLVREGIDRGLDPFSIVNEGLTKGLRQLGELFEEGKIFLPELIAGGEMVKNALDILKPHLAQSEKSIKTKGKFILGTVEGDIHDLGKNLVGLILSTSGYEVIDLGKDVPTDTFVKKVKEHKPKLLGLSALLTTTMHKQKEVIEALKIAGLRETVKIMVGGAPISKEWAEEIGADAYAEDAIDALRVADNLIS